jgi:hypothetical protein
MDFGILLIPLFAIFIIVALLRVIDGLKTGVIFVPIHYFYRDENPIEYWFIIVTLSFVVLIGIIGSLYWFISFIFSL